MPDFEIEKRFLKQGYRSIAGVDEVGRGALCGPVVAVSLVFPSALVQGRSPAWLRQANDSKLLTPKKRQELLPFILAEAESIGVGLCSNVEVDQINVYWASLQAMQRAVEQMPLRPDVLLVDGFELKDVPFVQQGIPQGDRKSYSIAAASIVAKVLRDEMMARCDLIFSGYSFDKNKGYGTQEHYRALEKYGQTSFHRQSFHLKS